MHIEWNHYFIEITRAGQNANWNIGIANIEVNNQLYKSTRIQDFVLNIIIYTNDTTTV